MSSLLRLERKQKISSNAFRICIFLISGSYSFGIETISMFIHSLHRSSLENHTRFQSKMGKSIPVFRPKRPKIHTLCGSTNLHGLYRGVPPPPLSPGEPERHKCRTVKPRFTDARFIQTHHYYRQFVLSLGKKAPTFSLNSIRLIWTLSMAPSVSVLTRFDCIIHFKLCSAAGFVLYCSVRFVSTTVTTGTVSK